MQYDTCQEIFYKRLSTLREQKGVSARNMSLSIGQCESYINSIENKKILPSLNVFFYICEFLNVSPSDFFNETNTHPAEIDALLGEARKLNCDELQHLLLITKDINKNKD